MSYSYTFIKEKIRIGNKRVLYCQITIGKQLYKTVSSNIFSTYHFNAKNGRFNYLSVWTVDFLAYRDRPNYLMSLILYSKSSKRMDLKYKQKW